MKKAIAFFICVALFAGCKTECGDCCLDKEPKPVQIQVQAGTQTQPGARNSFGDEQYVWESWQYGTNRVDKAK